MLELQKDLTILLQEDPEALFCITTNCVSIDGRNPMGAGTAALFNKLFPGIDGNLGKLLDKGKHEVVLIHQSPAVVAFPTIDSDWKSSLELISKSTKELVDFVDKTFFDKVFLPRPAAGVVGMPFENVRPILQELLDDRFVIVSL